MRFRAVSDGISTAWTLCWTILLAAITCSLAASPARAQRVLGIDVSAWQGPRTQQNWNDAYASGRRFAFIRVTHVGATNGDPDTEYANNFTCAKNAGFLVGPYCYARPTALTPIADADHFLKYAMPYIVPGNLPPVLDFEEGAGLPIVGAPNLCEWASVWLDRVRDQTSHVVAGGVAPIVYSNGNYANNYASSPRYCTPGTAGCCSLAPYVLWFARWSCGDPMTADPNYSWAPWTNWTFWQYCGGPVPGFSGNIDLDVFKGTMDELKKQLIGYPAISGVQAEAITVSGATITWTTRYAASSQVEWGPTTSYGHLSPLDATEVSAHSVTLSGMTYGTTYHFRVISTAYGQTAVSSDFTLTTASPPQILIDNTDAGCTQTGTWTSHTTGTYKIGSNYLTAAPNSSSTTATCRWTPNIPAAGMYDVYVYYQLASDRNRAAPYTIVYGGGTLELTQNQYSPSNLGGWFKLNSAPLPFAAGTGGYVQVGNQSTYTGSIGADAARFVRLDVQPPTAPPGLSAAAVSVSAIQLQWQPATDDVGVSGYKIYRDGVLVGTAGGTSFLDVGLTANTIYSYQVSAYDAMPNDGPLSSPAVSRATLPTPPGPNSVVPDKMSACTQATVAWTAVGAFVPGAVHHYRYIWDQNPASSFTGSEPEWSSGTLKTVMSAAGTWYLHLQACNADGLPNGTCDYAVTAAPSSAADFDGNCRVDGADLQAFKPCLSLPFTPPDPDCEGKDLDRDNDVDMDDFGLFQRSY